MGNEGKFPGSASRVPALLARILFLKSSWAENQKLLQLLTGITDVIPFCNEGIVLRQG